MPSDEDTSEADNPKLLSVLGKPYFDFLVYPKGDCWEKQGRLRKECFHHPDSLLIHDSTIYVFLDAFWNSHPKFNGYGPNEYFGENLASLRQRLMWEIQKIQSCDEQKNFLSLLTVSTTCDYDRVIEDWQSKWQTIRDELIEQGEQILDRAEQAQREEKSLLVLGI